MSERKSPEEFEKLLAASSLGMRGARAVRAKADPEAVKRILARAAELDAAGAPTEPDPDFNDDDALDPEFLAGLEAEIAELESGLMSQEAAANWWRHSRRAWGRLQQMRRGTRVRCPTCRGCRAGCPMCTLGFMSRDEAIAHFETEMELALK